MRTPALAVLLFRELLLHRCAAVAPSPPLTISAAGGALSLRLDIDSLGYSVSVDGDEWFDSGGADGGYAFSADGATASLAAGTLTALGAPVCANGSDAAGAFSSVSLSFSARGGAAEPQFEATFKAYEARPALVFAQRWLQPVPVAKGGSTFPSLRQVHNSSSSRQLGTLEYTGSSCGFMVGAQGEFPGVTGGAEKGFVVITPRDGSGAGAPASLAVGPVTEHFTNQARNEAGSLVYGLAPSFEALPAGYEIETVLAASVARPPRHRRTDDDPARASITGGGVNGALMEFGDFLLARHNKARAGGQHNTETTFLGYSTTAFYFYNLCDCLDEPPPTAVSGGKPDAHNRQSCAHSPIPPRYLAKAATPGVCASYADTLLAADAALAEQGIPIKHL
jgi:hypothetical protein